MADADEAYRRLSDWGSGVRIGLNATLVVLQALVLKRVITKQEALAMLDDIQRSVEEQSTTDAAQKKLAGQTIDQMRGAIISTS
jgi:hypothetical protein